jgi:hypothetical protein
MEIIVAVLVLLITVAYAVFIAVSIEKGKSWAVEIARAISVLDPQSVSFDLHQRAMESVTVRKGTAGNATPEPASDRLAA